ncbi:MAG: hypothetical protein Q8R82_21525 [Hyphomonadaceae bacterium]|nr:hypothetical protein [Hyphomonadaceae bacterium]
MKAQVVKLNLALPTAQAVTDNQIAIAFRPPLDGSVSLSDELDFDLECLDADQDVLNLTSGNKVRLKIAAHDIHDLRLPMRHGMTRFPALARRRGG